MEKLAQARDAFEKGLELDKDNATYVRCTKQELQFVMDAIAQRKQESLEVRLHIAPRAPHCTVTLHRALHAAPSHCTARSTLHPPHRTGYTALAHFTFQPHL